MTDYRFTKVLVWDNLGGSPKLARNQRVTVTDPDTGAVAAGLKVNGQPVPYVTTDSTGHVDFTSTQGVVRLTSSSGFWQDMESPDLRTNAVTASSDAAAAASSAATAASAASSSAADAAAARAAAETAAGNVSGAILRDTDGVPYFI